MSRVASTYVYCEYGRTATNRRTFETSPVTGSTSRMVDPDQSTSMACPGLWLRWFVTFLETA